MKLFISKIEQNQVHPNRLLVTAIPFGMLDPMDITKYSVGMQQRKMEGHPIWIESAVPVVRYPVNVNEVVKSFSTSDDESKIAKVLSFNLNPYNNFFDMEVELPVQESLLDNNWYIEQLSMMELEVRSIISSGDTTETMVALTVCEDKKVRLFHWNFFIADDYELDERLLENIAARPNRLTRSDYVTTNRNLNTTNVLLDGRNKQTWANKLLAATTRHNLIMNHFERKGKQPIIMVDVVYIGTKKDVDKSRKHFQNVFNEAVSDFQDVIILNLKDVENM